MWQPSDADTPVIRYLLGELSPEACEAYEDRYLSDETLHEELLAAEDELVDAYVRDELSPKQRTHFEHWFLRTQARQEQLKFAQALMRFGAKAAQASSYMSPGRAESSAPAFARFPWSLWVWLKARPPAVQLGFGSALILLVAMLLPRAFRPTERHPNAARQASDQSGTLPPSQAAPPSQVTPRPGTPEGVPQEASRRSQPEANDRALGKARARLDRVVLSVVILPSERQSGDEQTVRIPSNARTIRLQLPLLSDDYERYRVTLERVETGRPRILRGLRSQSLPGGDRALIASFPANDLIPGEYMAQVEGMGDASHLDPVGGYAFRVVRNAARPSLR